MLVHCKLFADLYIFKFEIRSCTRVMPKQRKKQSLYMRTISKGCLCFHGAVLILRVQSFKAKLIWELYFFSSARGFPIFLQYFGNFHVDYYSSFPFFRVEFLEKFCLEIILDLQKCKDSRVTSLIPFTQLPLVLTS